MPHSKQNWLKKMSIQAAPNVDMLKLNCHMKFAVAASKSVKA
jgi:hypothetical protein